jgi:MoxR-like ATPase
MNCVGSRIQLMPDTKPSEIIGTAVWDRKTESFRIVYGPAIKNHEGKLVQLLHADEINRTPAKTLASLLQPAEERIVTIDGVTIELPPLYMLCATMNGVESEGTYPVPDALKDRFAAYVKMRHVSREHETSMIRMLTKSRRKPLSLVQQAITVEDILEIRETVGDIANAISAAALDLIMTIARATRPEDEEFAAFHGSSAAQLKDSISYGASPRAEIWMTFLAASRALCEGRENITPADIVAVAPHVLRHRVYLTPAAQIDMDVDTHIIEPILAKVCLDAVRA